MQLVDTHCHLTFPQYDQDRDEVIEAVFSSGIVWVLNACSHVSDLPKMKDLRDKYPDKVFLSIGIHPHYASQVGAVEFSQVEKELDEGGFVAIGEVGIDLFRNEARLEDQINLLVWFIKVAKDRGLPLIFHCRDAEKELLSVLDDLDVKGGFVVHCFSGGVGFAKDVLDRGGMLSFTANCTYKKSEPIREAIKFVPLDRIMLETDSPYLPPQSQRGKRNDPRAVIEVAKMVAELKSMQLEKVAEITTGNAERFFRGEDGC